MRFVIGRRFLVAACLLVGMPGVRADPPRIEPDGIPGTLLLSASADPGEAVLKSFLRAAGKEGPVHAILDGADEPLPPAVKERSKVVALRDLKGQAVPADARALWIVPGKHAKGHLDDAAAAARQVLQAKGTVVLAGPGQERLAASLLPDAVFTDGDPMPGKVALKVPAGGGLLIRGREVVPLGDLPVRLRLAAGGGRAARVIELKSPAVEDWTGLRRAARARTEKPFPPADNPVPEVRKGTLVIVGGGGSPKGLYHQFVEMAGGKKSVIVVLPTAVPDPFPAKDRTAEVFRKAGAGKVITLAGRTKEEVESPAYEKAFREATGIWFGGGRQWRFVDAYAGTKAHGWMQAVLDRGGVIGGSSAGATIQGDYLCRGSPLGNLAITYEGYERGMGFLPGVGIDQHFSQRKRQPDMLGLMKRHPQLLGIGIDEATALLVRGHVGEVLGKGRVFFFDARERETPRVDSLPSGGRYDLKARKVIPE